MALVVRSTFLLVRNSCSSDIESSCLQPGPWCQFKALRITRSNFQKSAPRAAKISASAVSRASDEVEEKGERETWDVSSNCVTPVFRSASIQDANAAILTDLLRRHNLQNLVECSSKAVRDYNEGEPPDPRAALVAEDRGLTLPEGKVATVFNCAVDIAKADLVLVFDKFIASDALKEVTVYETVDKTRRYTPRVRRMGEFCIVRNVEDIEDPLYGNMGGPEELELLNEVFDQIRDSCEGLVQSLERIRSNLRDGESFKEGMKRYVENMDGLNWLVPPMLSRT